MAADPKERLRILLEAWYAEVEAGGAPTVEALCAGDPELVPDLRCLVATGDRVARAASGTGGTAGPETGDRLGDFRLLRRLGAGGMGEVWLAHDGSLHRLVALKVLRDIGTDERTRLRFLREAEIAASLDHPNIVPIHATGTDGDRTWIAMKWLSGPGLDQLEALLSPREAARVLVPVAKALDEAHKCGIVHRDLKPANIVLDGDVPYVVDFGLARAAGRRALTREGAVPGTLAYMSPEQVRGGAAVDSRTDVYALGATLFDLLAGRPPFAEDDPEALVHAILFRDPPPVGLTRRDRDLETIVFRALDKDPVRRFPTAGAFADDLERYLRDEPIVSRQAGPADRALRLVRRRPRTALAVGTATAIGLALGGLRIADHVRAERIFAEEAAQAGRLIDDGDLPAAGALVASLERSAPARRETKDLRRRLVAVRALEDLLDHVMDRREGQDATLVRDQLSAVEEGVDLSRDRARSRLFGLARAVARLHLGESKAALALLHVIEWEHGPARDIAALAAAGEGGSWELPPPATASADERVFTWLAMRAAGRPRADQEQEIEAALKAEDAHLRARHARAVFLAEEETQASNLAALEAFRGLARNGRYRAATLRNLARQEMLLGRLAEARRRLAMIEGVQESAPATAAEAVLRCDVLAREGKTAELVALLEAALKRWPADPELLLAAGGADVDAGRPERGHERCEAAARFARTTRQRERAEAAALLAELSAVPGSGQMDPLRGLEADERQDLLALAGRADSAVGRFRDGKARSDALLVKARVLGLLGDRRAAQETLEESMAAAPSSPGPLVHAILGVGRRLQLAEQRGREDPAEAGIAGSLPDAVALARRRAREILAHEGLGHFPPTPCELELVLRCEAAFAAFVGDRAGCAEAAGRALEHLRRRPEGASSEETAAHLEALRRWALENR